MSTPGEIPEGTGRIRRVVTDSRGGVSYGAYASFNLGDHVGDDPSSVARNRRRLAERIGLPPHRLVWMDQVHGTRVARVRRPTGGAVPDTDALVTDVPDLALVVLTADCVPILAADPVTGVLGAAHAGRRGATDGIARTLVEAMCAMGAEAGRIEVLLGPAASGRRYELPEDLADRAEEALPGSRTPTVDGTCGVDLRAGLVRQLTGLGVSAIACDPRCTIEDPTLFSYRRSGRTGRQASLIWRQS